MAELCMYRVPHDNSLYTFFAQVGPTKVSQTYISKSLDHRTEGATARLF